MRRPEQRKERACIRPEISRTRTYGKIGVSKYVHCYVNNQIKSGFKESQFSSTESLKDSKIVDRKEESLKNISVISTNFQKAFRNLNKDPRILKNFLLDLRNI